MASTQDAAGGGGLYAASEKIHPREVDGRFQRLRVASVYLLLGLYYVLPWVRWEGRQAVLFDLPARKFHLFGLTLWPQDLFLLTLLLIIAALTLFFFTALLGRVWCGYACPQTVWTEVFVWMERLAEGKRHKRIKLDRGRWTVDKLWRKAFKHGMWLAFAAFTGFTFVGYFTPIDVLAGKLYTLSLGGWETFWIAFYSFATWGNAGFMREQVCKYMCPYARFQSVMFDRNTLIISYDRERGEPRGGRRRGATKEQTGLGDCIDCHKCVQVCPTGIDIREGLQYECIACAACVDVCDEVMDTMGYERGLVRYTSENALENNPARIVRPRVIVYALLLLLICGGFLALILNRTPLRMDVLRDRNALYRIVEGGIVENVYTLKVTNISNEPRVYDLSVSGLPQVSIESDADPLAVPAGAITAFAARVRAPGGLVAGGHDIVIRLAARDDPGVAVDEHARFLAPVE